MLPERQWRAGARGLLVAVIGFVCLLYAILGALLWPALVPAVLTGRVTSTLVPCGLALVCGPTVVERVRGRRGPVVLCVGLAVAAVMLEVLDLLIDAEPGQTSVDLTDAGLGVLAALISLPVVLVVRSGRVAVA